MYEKTYLHFKVQLLKYLNEMMEKYFFEIGIELLCPYLVQQQKAAPNKATQGVLY